MSDRHDEDARELVDAWERVWVVRYQAHPARADLIARIAALRARSAEFEAGYKELADEHVALRRRVREHAFRFGVPSNPAWSLEDFKHALDQIEAKHREPPAPDAALVEARRELGAMLDKIDAQVAAMSPLQQKRIARICWEVADKYARPAPEGDAG